MAGRGWRWVLALAAPMLAAILPARAQTPIVYAYPEQSVWTTLEDAQGNPANPLLRAADALFRRAGLPWRGEAYPAARMFEHLRTGTANFSMLVRSAQLDECCLVGRRPVASTELHVYRQPATPAVASREALRGTQVIAIRGYSYGGLLAYLNDPANGITVSSAPSHQAAFTMLERGRADYLLDYAGPAREILAARHGLTLPHDTLERLDVHLVLGRGYPEAEATLARLEAIAADLDLAAIAGLAAR